MNVNAKSIAATAAAVTPFLGLFAFWDKLEPALNWGVKLISLIASNSSAQALLESIGAAVVLCAFIPYLPGLHRLQPSTTKAWTRFGCGLLTFTFYLVLVEPVGLTRWAHAVFEGIIAGGAASALWTTAAGLLYKVADKPESLK